MVDIRIKHAGSTHTLELAHGECPYRRVGALLNIPVERITIIRAGKKLPPPGDPTLPTSLVVGALYLVSGTRNEDMLPTTTQRYVSDASEAASEAATGLYSRLTWDYCIALLFWLLSLLQSLGRASISFVSSMVIAPDPARQGQHGQRRAPERAAAQMDHDMPPQ